MADFNPLQYPRHKALRYGLAVLGILIGAAALLPFRTNINSTTVALALLLIVLFVASLWGSRPAFVSSIVGVLCFNYFFLPPFGTLTINDPQNWAALAAFLITATTAGQLSAWAKRRAEEAQQRRLEIERLYAELQEAFVKASHAEALRQSEGLKSALLDAVTHDLRTPLTSIKASITTLLDELDGRSMVLDNESRREMLDIINEESDRLNRFIGGLIDLARIEAGELHLRRRWGAVDEIVSAALARAELLVKGRVVEVEIEDEIPIVRVDSRAVSEVVYTLVDNAAKYSPPQSPIRITARRGANDIVEIAVEDQGAGIAASLRQRVFDKFFRAIRDGDVGTQQPAGTGMGLAIAKGIVEAHNGRIWIEDGNGGRGTRVVFTVPIGDEDALVEESTKNPEHSN